MTNRRFNRQVEKVSEVLSFVASYDPETLLDLQEWFQEIAEMAKGTSQPEVAAVAIAASNVSERMILNSEYDLGMFYMSPHQEEDPLTKTARKEKIRDDLLEELLDIAPRFKFDAEKWDDGTELPDLSLAIA